MDPMTDDIEGTANQKAKSDFMLRSFTRSLYEHGEP